MKKILILFLLIGGMTANAIAQAPLQEYTYWDTIRYTNGNFTSSHTVFSDLNEDDQIVGYFLNASNNYVGFVYDLKNNKYHTYSHPGYTHTQITGINTFGEILGKTYNSVTAARAFRGNFTNNSIQNVQLIAWGGTTTSPNQEPSRLNSNGVGSGTVRSGAGSVNRWITYENIFPPLTVSGIKRVEISAIPFNTYGLGVNNANQVSGWYLNGTSYRPVVFDHSSNSFSYFNQKIIGANARTKFNDINDNGFVAVEYRDNLGFWQGTIAGLSGSTADYESDANFIFSQTKTPNGSSIQGLNNSNDIVGYVNTPNGDRVAFFAITDAYGMEHPEMDEIDGVFQIENSATYFDYDLNHYNYASRDVWLDTPDAFVQNYINPIYANANPQTSQLPSLGFNAVAQGQIYPSWNAFVYAQRADSCYRLTSNVLRPKMSSILSWLNKSEDVFPGYCYGISAFALQHFRDTLSLDNRFNNIADQANINFYDSLSTGMNLPLIETMAALWLHQYDSDVDKYWDTLRNYKWIFNNGSNAQLNQMTRNATSIMAHSILNVDSARIMSWGLSVPNNQFGYHSVTPIGIIREFEYVDPKDSLYIIDSNYPNEFPVVVFDPVFSDITEYHSQGQTTISFYFADANIHEVDVATPAKISSRPPRGSQGSLYKTIGNRSLFYTNNVCDYIITDNSNPSNQFSHQGGQLSNNYNNLVPQYKFDADRPPLALRLNGSFDTRTSLTACNSDLQWVMSYPKGEILFGRAAALPAETDVVYNNNEIVRLENPDAIDKYVKLASNYGPGNEESYVAVDSFKLEQNDSLRYETLDQYNFKLSNGKNSPNSYNLFVRYLAPSEYFVWQTQKINISPTTDHIIQLRPTSPTQKVVILIDSLQDGTIDDSIAVVNGGLSNPLFLAENYSIKVFPNPTNDQFTLQMNQLEQGTYQVMVYNQIGQLVRSKGILPDANGEVKETFSLQDMPRGMYLIRVQNTEANFRYQHKLMLR